MIYEAKYSGVPYYAAMLQVAEWIEADSYYRSPCGYVYQLQSSNCSESVKLDSLDQLKRYVPLLFDRFIAAEN